jgi:hypothetical protein
VNICYNGRFPKGCFNIAYRVFWNAVHVQRGTSAGACVYFNIQIVCCARPRRNGQSCGGMRLTGWSPFAVKIWERFWSSIYYCYLLLASWSSCSNYIATDGQWASSSWCRATFGAQDQIQFCLFDNYFLLHVGPPLWREDGSVMFSAITQQLESRRTHSHILLSHMRPPPPGRGGRGRRIYISQEQGFIYYYYLLLTFWRWSRVYDQQSVGQSVLVSGGCTTSRHPNLSDRKQKSGHEPQWGAQHQDRLANSPSVVN